jgi:hypothetical protein
MSRFFVHMLLPLLLLLTQQMSLQHAAAHLAEACSPHGAQAAGQVEPAETGGKPALHHLCVLCLDGAQLAFSLPASTHGFVPLALAYDSPTGILRTGIQPQPVHLFQPRGPPLA